MSITIEIAQNAGACYGVKRALEMAHGAAESAGPVHTLGPLIHNPRVVDDLAAQGVLVADTLDEVVEGTLVLRSHGTAPQIVDAALDRGLAVVDATCPYVSKVQRKARQLAEEGYAVVIIGEPGHAEVEGIRAWGGEAVIAVADVPEKLPDELPARVGVVIQTTQSAIVSPRCSARLKGVSRSFVSRRPSASQHRNARIAPPRLPRRLSS